MLDIPVSTLILKLNILKDKIVTKIIYYVGVSTVSAGVDTKQQQQNLSSL